MWEKDIRHEMGLLIILIAAALRLNNSTTEPSQPPARDAGARL